MTFEPDVRHLDMRETLETGRPGDRTQLLSNRATAVTFARHLTPGSGSDLHYHREDKVCFVLHGTMTTQIGEDVHRLGEGSFVVVPAGLAHRNWNDGSGTETHLEMMVAAPSSTADLELVVATPGEVPEPHRANRGVHIARVDRRLSDEVEPGVFVQELTEPRAPGVNARHVRIEPGSGGLATRVAEDDHYLLVLEGQLTVTVGSDRWVVDAGSLVVLPLGTECRCHNGGRTRERHLSVGLVLTDRRAPAGRWEASR